MPSIFDLVSSSLGNGAVSKIGAQLGQDSATTRNAIGSALPLLLSALGKSARADSGAGLARALNSRHDGSLLDDVQGYLERDDGRDGAAILRHVLGSRQERAAAALQQTSGIDRDKASTLLATLAPVVLGALGKAKRESGIRDDELNSMLDGETRDLEARAPGTMSALLGILDADGDGDTDLADVVARGSSFLGGLFRGRRSSPPCD